jgi:putative ABC transport system substrate-binding protein
MKRRDFLGILAGAAAAWPLTSRAQSAMPVIGFLAGTSPQVYAPRLLAFAAGLKQEGYVDGQNVAVEYRWGGGETMKNGCRDWRPNWLTVR